MDGVIKWIKNLKINFHIQKYQVFVFIQKDIQDNKR